MQPERARSGDSLAQFFGAVPTVRYAVERVSRPDWRIAPRRLDHFNLILLQGGELRATVEGREHVLNESGQYILFLPGVQHSAVTNPDDLMHCYSFEFRLTHVESGRDLKTVPFPAVGRLLPSAKALRAAHELARVWRVRPLAYELQVRSLALEVLCELFRQHHLSDIEPHKIRLVEEACRFIRANYMKRLTLADIAAGSGLSPTYFGAIFRRVTGQTPIEYLNGTRVRVAQDILLSTSLTVAEVAAQVGVEDLPYFSRLFKKYSGYAPSEFRRRH